MTKNNDIKILKTDQKEVFNIPDGYFEQLPIQINNLLTEDQKSLTKRFLLMVKPHFTLAFAMVSLFLIIWAGLSWFDINIDGSNENRNEIAELTEMDIYGFEEAMIIEVINDSVPVKDPEINAEEIISFLILEGADVSGLLNQLNNLN